ncbi:MAG: hypothetical protein H6732_08035 [Alphaproteobacteria bacterium]|nr:hypothetical protein [Alphaproteobacteria bacterium]
MLRGGGPLQQTTPPLAAWLLAFALPVVAVGVVTSWAARGGPTGEAATQAEVVARLDPEMVVLGASVATHDVDLDALAERLGRDPARMVTVAVNNAALPVWYLALRNRVFRVGARPDVVLVVGTLGQILEADLPAQHDRIAFARELVGDESEHELAPVGAHAGTLALQARARSAVDEVTHLFRGLALRATRGGDAREIERRIDATWDVLAPPPLEQMRTIDPHAVQRYERFLTRFETLVDPEATLLGSLVELAAAHEATVVVVRAPVAPGAPFDVGDLDAAAGGLRAFLEARGAHYVDLAGLTLPDDAFRDPLHMSHAGAVPFATAIADALEGLGLQRVPAR